jgi:RNA polymerase sigma factor (sigma-70 family)
MEVGRGELDSITKGRGERFGMTHVASSAVIRQLGELFEGASSTGLSDRQLLERYITGGGDAPGEAAFAALVGRHGPMVLAVCRKVLGDHHHAEDAVQAVFLILAQKARTIHEPHLLGNWLYGVAIRTARCARQRIARRRRGEGSDATRGSEAGTDADSCAAVGSTSPPADRRAIDREQAEALHDEITRLPRAFRLPVVLCYFEGLTIDEAARRLRRPVGTLHSRLARAREKLRIGLIRRGIMISGQAMMVALVPRSASASIPPLLCNSIARAAIAFAARRAPADGALSAPAAALAQEVLRTMLIHKFRLVVAAVLGLAAVVSGAGYLTHVLATARDDVGRGTRNPAHPVATRPPDQDAARTGPHPPDTNRPAPGRMTVSGRVIGPDGRPGAGVPVAVIGTSRRVPQADADMGRAPYVVLGQGAADGDGRFRIEAVRGSSTRFFAVYALAGAAVPGSAFGCVKFHPERSRHPEIQTPTKIQTPRGPDTQRSRHRGPDTHEVQTPMILVIPGGPDTQRGPDTHDPRDPRRSRHPEVQTPMILVIPVRPEGSKRSRHP